MGTPVTLDNYNQLAQAQGRENQKALEARVEKEWDNYKQNHQKWAETFKSAETKRRAEEANWRKFYKKVFDKENDWVYTTTMFVLNGIQIWALTQQYNQQKEIAKRTYELANRQLNLAEGMFSYYKSSFQPHEIEIGKQIDSYFNDPYKPQYEITSGRFALNARVQMLGKRREVLMCASQYCTGALRTSLKDIALQEANMVANALNSGVKYEKLREFKMEQKWLQARLAFVASGRGVAMQGVTGIDGAFKAFHSFGADPGAALSQLLTTVAHTVGGIIPNPTHTANKAPVVDATPVYTKPTSSVVRSTAPTGN